MMTFFKMFAETQSSDIQLVVHKDINGFPRFSGSSTLWTCLVSVSFQSVGRSNRKLLIQQRAEIPESITALTKSAVMLSTTPQNVKVGKFNTWQLRCSKVPLTFYLPKKKYRNKS